MTLDYIKAHWPIITALVVCGTAWGQQQQKVATLETAVIRMKEQDDKIGAVKEQAVRNEEQLKMIRVQLETQEKLLRALVDASTVAKRAAVSAPR